jgi:hypothetical protein
MELFIGGGCSVKDCIASFRHNLQFKLNEQDNQSYIHKFQGWFSISFKRVYQYCDLIATITVKLVVLPRLPGRAGLQTYSNQALPQPDPVLHPKPSVFLPPEMPHLTQRNKTVLQSWVGKEVY